MEATWFRVSSNYRLSSTLRAFFSFTLPEIAPDRY